MKGTVYHLLIDDDSLIILSQICISNVRLQK